MDRKSLFIINVIISCRGRVRSWLRRRKKLAREKSFELKEKSDDDGREVGEGWVGMSREQVHGCGVGVGVGGGSGEHMTSHP